MVILLQAAVRAAGHNSHKSNNTVGFRTVHRSWITGQTRYPLIAGETAEVAFLLGATMRYELGHLEIEG